MPFPVHSRRLGQSNQGMYVGRKTIHCIHYVHTCVDTYNTRSTTTIEKHVLTTAGARATTWQRRQYPATPIRVPQFVCLHSNLMSDVNDDSDDAHVPLITACDWESEQVRQRGTRLQARAASDVADEKQTREGVVRKSRKTRGDRESTSEKIRSKPPDEPPRAEQRGDSESCRHLPSSETGERREQRGQVHRAPLCPPTRLWESHTACRGRHSDNIPAGAFQDRVFQD